jgi:DAK2 domain
LSQPNVDLSHLFGAALQAMTDNRQQVNALDGYNGNHGDNMVDNLRIITEALRASRANAPSDALAHASRQLQANGRGGTGPHYARGLQQAADQLQGRSQLELGDVASLLQTVLSNVPATGGQPPAPAAAEGLAESLLEMLTTQQPQSRNVLQDLLSTAGGATGAAEQPGAAGQDTGDLMDKLLPAGMAFLQAKQGGADNVTAGTQALMRALMAGSVNPGQAASPRSAAAGLVAQSILRAVAGR